MTVTAKLIYRKNDDARKVRTNVTYKLIYANVISGEYGLQFGEMKIW